MPKKTPAFKHYPAWTEARFWGFIRSGLRAKWSRWPPKYEVLNKAKRLKPKNKKGRHRFEYQCSQCNQWWMNKEVEVDHITPCGSLKSYADLVGFVERLFTSADRLRVVCKPCHRIITKKERE